MWWGEQRQTKWMCQTKLIIYNKNKIICTVYTVYIYCVYTKMEFVVLAVGVVAIRGFGQGMGVGIWQPHPVS